MGGRVSKRKRARRVSAMVRKEEAHGARRADDVDALIRIARMDEISSSSSYHASIRVPVEGDVVLDRGNFGKGIGVSSQTAFSAVLSPAVYPRPIGRIAL